jgi:hypothetical protein
MKILKFLLFVVLFVALVILFLPKENLYYLAEGQLFKLDGGKVSIVLSNESLSDNGFVLKVQNADVFADALPYFSNENVAHIEELNVVPLIAYNEVNIKHISVAQKFQNFIPAQVESATLKFSLFYPVKVWIHLEGEFGRIDGSYNIYSKTIHLNLEPDNGIAARYPDLYKNFKDVEGELVYESSF